MAIHKDGNGNVQVEFNQGEVIPLVIGLPQEEGNVIPAMVILPMHEALVLNDPTQNKLQFTDFNVRMIFKNIAEVDFMQMQLDEARRILSIGLTEEENESSNEE